MDNHGYLQLVDFGFAKRIPGTAGATGAAGRDATDLDGPLWTLCGTPAYLSPEMLLHKGHGRPVDMWAFGVLIYECLVGTTPFEDDVSKQKMVRVFAELGIVRGQPRALSASLGREAG